MFGFERDVIVAGGGPAGTICASYLARAGADVLLLDKSRFPRDKACGDIVTEGIAARISDIGAGEELDKMSTCIRRLRLTSNDGSQAVIPFECYSVPRYELDAMLIETAVKNGVEVRQGYRVTDVIEEDGFIRGVRASFAGSEFEMRSKIVIGADGAYSQVAKSIGIMKEKDDAVSVAMRTYFRGVKLDRTQSRGQYDACGMLFFDESVRPCCFWVTPVGRNGVRDGYCNVGMMINDSDMYGDVNLMQRFESWVSGHPEIAEMFDGAQQVGEWVIGKLTNIRQGIRRCGSGFILAGDAASVMLPLINDGLAAAAESAEVAAAAAMKAIRHEEYSGQFIADGYMAAARARELRDKLIWGPPLADFVKERELIVQSMYDPGVMDRVVKKLAADRGYLNQLKKDILGL